MTSLLAQPNSRGSIPNTGRCLSLLQNPDRLWSAHSRLSVCYTSTGSSFPGREALTTVRLGMSGAIPLRPLYAFMARTTVMLRAHFRPY